MPGFIMNQIHPFKCPLSKQLYPFKPRFVRRMLSGRPLTRIVLVFIAGG